MGPSCLLSPSQVTSVRKSLLIPASENAIIQSLPHPPPSLPRDSSIALSQDITTPSKTWGVNLNDNLLIDFDNYFRKHIWGLISRILCLSLSYAKNSLQFFCIKPTKCISVRIYLEKVSWDKLKIMDSVYGKMGVPWYKSPFIDTQKFALMPFKWTLKLCATIRVSVPCFIVI